MRINKGIKLTHSFKNGLNRESSNIKNFETILGEALSKIFEDLTKENPYKDLREYRLNYKENGKPPFDITYLLADRTRFIKYYYPMEEDKTIRYDMIIDISGLHLPREEDVLALCIAIDGELILDYKVDPESELYRINHQRRRIRNIKYQTLTEKVWLYAQNN